MSNESPLYAFLAYLERCGYEVTINDFCGLIVADATESQRLAPFMIHRNAFCMAVKSDRRLWDECLARKVLLCAAAGRALRNGIRVWRGMCYQGREEFVTVVANDDIVLATIALGGFASNLPLSLHRVRRCLGGPADPPAGRQRPQPCDPEVVFTNALALPPPTPADAGALLAMAAAELRRIFDRLEQQHGSLTVSDAARISREHRLCLHAAEFLRRHVTQPVAAREVAAACHVSVSTLSHVFKKTMGTSVRRYLLRLRIEHAKRLLAGGSDVTTAALDSGFDDPNYFSRAFRAHEGCPPSRWRADDG